MTRTTYNKFVGHHHPHASEIKWKFSLHFNWIFCISRYFLKIFLNKWKMFHPNITFSVRPFVVHHISGTIHHLVVIYRVSQLGSTSGGGTFWANWPETAWTLVVLGQANSSISRGRISLRNSIAYHDFWCTCAKWWYLQVLFLFLNNSDFFGC